MRKALIIGINDYSNNPLKYCISDAQRIANILSKNDDLSPNFDCKVITSDEINITERVLKTEIKELFKSESEVALFYFAGHGSQNDIGGSLVTQDSTVGDEGVNLSEILKYANQSPVKEIVIILDCCYSGQIGDNLNNLRKGVSILASSSHNESSEAKYSGGVFTSIICEGLNGLAADILGNVTVSEIYNYADKLLGPWEQRPIFKAYLSKMISLRLCKPKIELATIRRLIDFFDESSEQLFQLSPDYEPTATPRNKVKEETFSILQKLTALNLVEPIGADHMYFAAINSKSCQLTALGKYYWKLVLNNRI